MLIFSRGKSSFPGRQKWLLLGAAVALSLLACSRAYYRPVAGNPEQAETVLPFGRGNNAYFPNLDYRLPLELAKDLRPISAPMEVCSVWDGVLFVSTRNGRVESYDLARFKRLARKKMPGASHARVLPYRGDLLIALEFGRKSLMRVDGLTGKVLWRAELHGIAAFPKVVGGRLYVATLRRGVVALDPENGRILWRVPLEDQVHGAPAVLDSSLVVATDAGEVLLLSLRGGQELWHYSHGQPIVADPVVQGRRVLVAGSEGKVALLNASGEPAWQRNFGTQIYRTPAIAGDRAVLLLQDGRGVCVSLQQGKTVWETHLGAPAGTRPMVTARHIAVGLLDRRIVFLDRETGEEVWEMETYGRVRTDFLPWRHFLITGSEDNHVYLLQEKPVPGGS